MKTLIMKFTLLVLMLMDTSLAMAQLQGVQALKITNPTQTIGIHIGDVLKRTITFESAAFQKFETDNLPMEGTRDKGIELIDAKVITEKKSSIWHYKIDLSYQVFANATIATVMQLPAEKVKLSASENLTIPVWRFWFSPLVVSSIDNVQASIQPQAPTPLISVVNVHYTLMMLIVFIAISLAGLLYVNIDSQWLPFIGGPFAKSYKAIKKIAKGKGISDKPKSALLEIHEAFNHIHGGNLFASDLDMFLANNPKYQKLRAEIYSFFTLSNHALFSSQLPYSSDLVNKLIDLSKRLRDCERGV